MRRFTQKAVVWLIAAAITGSLSAYGSAGSLRKLVDAVLRNGPDSQLPAHLSMVLGVSRLEQATPVKQAVMRDGSIVRTCNVSTANHDDVVLIKYDEQSRSAQAYLVSPAGVLRKAVTFQAGAAASERAVAEAGRDLASEIKFWMAVENTPAVPAAAPRK